MQEGHLVKDIFYYRDPFEDIMKKKWVEVPSFDGRLDSLSGMTCLKTEGDDLQKLNWRGKPSSIRLVSSD